MDQERGAVEHGSFSRQNINISESPKCKLSQLEPSGVGREGDTELGQTSLRVSSPTACFLEVKSGYEEHQGEVIRRQATTWGCVCCVLIGGGDMGESRPRTWPCLMAHWVIS